MTSEGQKLIQNAKTLILNSADITLNIEEIKIAMNQVYRYFKGIYFSFNDYLEIFKLEQLLASTFLSIESEPYFDPDEVLYFPSIISCVDDCVAVMRYVVHEGRIHLAKHHDLKTSSLKSRCHDSAYNISKICREHGIEYREFMCSEDLSPGLFHCFNIIKFNIPNSSLPSGFEEKYYLVDCTYRQFFTYADSFLERIGLEYSFGPNIGAYMLISDDRKRIANELLVNGFIELTPEVLKTYLSSFIFSGRNGEYYSKLGKTELSLEDFEVNYTLEELIDALLSKRGVGESNLGRQNVPSIEIMCDYTDPVSKLV